ncbi:bidirectional sugar transporter SWEET7-like [Coffea arabica]|uniref:Bidirectional sugar transporter SWEET n=2 Tax=Coffea TaxID=13442 RepID=A0ABM4W7J7_COFAR
MYQVVRTIMGILGNFTSFCLFASPVFTFARIVKMKSVEEFHPYPYLAGALNCFFWVFYGSPMVHPNSILVIITNSIGFVLELAYLAIFFHFSHSKKQRLIVVFGLIGEAVFAAGIALITLLVFHNTDGRSLFVGAICVAFSIILSASPLSIMKQVIKTKSVEFMPFWICLAGFCNGTVWAVYALLPLDPFILTGNGVGALLGFVQLCLHTKYRKTTPKGGSNDMPGKPSELQLPVSQNQVSV